LQRLAHPANIAMAKNPKTARKKWPLNTIAFDILLLEERNQCLGHREYPW
jgi:hypothetical protein